MLLFLSCSCLCPIYWSQELGREWKYSWSSADGWCSIYIWVINNFIAYQCATYIRGFTVNIFMFRHNSARKPKHIVTSTWCYPWVSIGCDYTVYFISHNGLESSGNSCLWLVAIYRSHHFKMDLMGRLVKKNLLALIFSLSTLLSVMKIHIRVNNCLILVCLMKISTD